jgi:hypothetical protein
MSPIKPPVGPALRRPTPPYDTGKVKIGLCYTAPPNWSASRDSYNLQTALLSGPAVRPIRLTLSERLSTFFRSFV